MWPCDFRIPAQRAAVARLPALDRGGAGVIRMMRMAVRERKRGLVIRVIAAGEAVVLYYETCL